MYISNSTATVRYCGPPTHIKTINEMYLLHAQDFSVTNTSLVEKPRQNQRALERAIKIIAI